MTLLRTTALALMTIAAVGVVGACSAGAAPSAIVPAPATVATADQGNATVVGADQGGAMLQFGQSHTWPNGDTITVSNLRTIPGAPTSDHKWKRVIAVDVIAHNASGQPQLAQDFVTYADVDGDNAEEIAVSGLNRPNGWIPPGGQQHWTIAWQIVKTEPVTLTVQAFGAGGDPQRPVVFYQGEV